MLNTLILECRLVETPALKTLSNEKQTKVVNFRVAHNKSKEDTIFLSVVAYNNTAELLSTLEKGKRLTLQGRLNQNTWEDDSHQKHQSWEMIADQIHFTDSAKKEDKEN